MCENLSADFFSSFVYGVGAQLFNPQKSRDFQDFQEAKSTQKTKIRWRIFF